MKSAIMFLSVLAALLTGGCATDSVEANRRAVERYLTRNPGRPQAIQDALYTREPVNGMTRDEVTLCWGRPDTKDYALQGKIREETWNYYDGNYDPDGRIGLWNTRIPLAKVVFQEADTEFYVTETRVYGEQKPSADAGKKATAPRPQPKPAEIVAPPADQLAADWPSLAIKGIVRRGNQNVALVNEKMVAPGDLIDNVFVAAVQSDGVVLQCQKGSRFVPAGGVTP